MFICPLHLVGPARQVIRATAFTWAVMAMGTWEHNQPKGAGMQKAPAFSR